MNEPRDPALAYRRIPEYPVEITPVGMLTRLVDAVGFRYYWATEGLPEDCLQWRVTPESMSVGELLRHVHGLLMWVSGHFPGAGDAGSAARADRRHLPEWPTPAEFREVTLRAVWELRRRLLEFPSERLGEIRIYRRGLESDIPFWNLINGPLADALTHIGQLNSWRRIMGRPAAGADVFLGRPPGA